MIVHRTAGAPGVSPGHQFGGVEVVGVSKAFGSIRALEDVSVTIEPGTIHALVGENGAGKSTLGKIIAGVLEPDAGHVAVAGHVIRMRTPRDALEAGIAAIEQEISLAPNLTAEENVFLGAEPRRFGFIRRRDLDRQWAELLAETGFQLRGNALAGALPLGERQQVEILRALSRRADLIIMDEPTAALNEQEAAVFHATLRAVVGRGASVVIVTHFLREVLELADHISVLRDGRLVQSSPASGQTEPSLIRAMLGRELSAVFPPLPTTEVEGPAVLRVRDLVAPGVDCVSLEVHAGEIVGLAGLDGSGRAELGAAIYGDVPTESGSVEVLGRPLGVHQPSGSLRQGLALIPASRRDDGLFLVRPVTENSSISSLRRLTRFGVVRRSEERRVSKDVYQRLDVPSGRGRQPVSTLSGGNQQKVMLARVLLRDTKVLIACEPTRGVDVGAKSSIYQLLTSLAADGMGLLLVSSEPEELIGLSHRVMVMRRGRVAAELTGAGITEEAILTAALTDTTPIEESKA